ncbi:MAG: S8 family peptidase [Lachnospiraceae bacterium]|nr:S8 family peptidase [Lachnospiraceae bacterium]
MTCRDAILSNDYMDLIGKTDTELPLKDFLLDAQCVQRVSPVFSVFYVERERLLGTRMSLPVGDFPGSVCYAPMDTESLEKSGVYAVQRQSALELSGEGVIVGFLDSGIALGAEVFRTGGGRSRVFALWDQTDQSGTPPEGFAYGSVYSTADIDRMLEEGREELPGTDETGHGTKLASIAAGSALPDADFTGAAPQAQIAFVKLKEAKPFMRELQRIPQDVVAYEEADLMLAVRWLDELAQREGKPLVLCIALGSNAGGHTGETALGQYLQAFSRKPGRVIVAAAGNEGSAAHHFYGTIPAESDYVDVELRVGANVKGFQLNLWGDAPGLLTAEVIAPGGERVPESALRRNGRARYDFIFERTILDMQYEWAEPVSGDERLLLAFQEPTEGIWTIRVYSAGDFACSFHAWLPVTGFLSTETYFLRPDPDTTVTCPANAEGVISFAGYDARRSSVWQEASRGYTRSRRLAPDLAAPAVEVSAVNTRGIVSTLSGTSASAAIGAGACALLLEWGIVRGNAPAMDSVAAQRYLVRGAVRPEPFAYPNRNWGYGLLDLYGVFRTL